MGKRANEIAFENDQISDFEGLVTLALDRVILHTVVHHSSTSTYMPNYIEIEKTFCGQTNGHTYVQMHGRTFETGFIRSTLSKSWPKKGVMQDGHCHTLRPPAVAQTTASVLPNYCPQCRQTAAPSHAPVLAATAAAASELTSGIRTIHMHECTSSTHIHRSQNTHNHFMTTTRVNLC